MIVYLLRQVIHFFLYISTHCDIIKAYENCLLKKGYAGVCGLVKEVFRNCENKILLLPEPA